MAYELEEDLKELITVLEAMDKTVDDEELYENDEDQFGKDIFDQKTNIQKCIDVLVDEDPEIPVDYVGFLNKMEEVIKKGTLDYNRLTQFSVDQLLPFKNELQDLIEEEKPKQALFDQLTIPIISLVNHQSHPSRPGYMVYHFKLAEHADYFEELLKEKEFFYERHDEIRQEERIYWFGVRDQDNDAVEILNYTVKGKFRKPLIKDKAARYFVIAIGVGIILVAIIGAIISNM